MSESARSHSVSRIKTVGEDHRVHQNSTRLKPAETAVRPTLLPEGWTVSLRQVQYSHVETGMICFQIPENPVVLNDLVFKELQPVTELIASAKTTGNQSRTVRTLISKTTISAVGSTRKITSSTPLRWNDPLCLRNDRRRPMTTTTPENSPSKDVIELKHAAP